MAQTTTQPFAPPPPSAATHKAIIFEDVVMSFGTEPVLNGVSFALGRGENKMLLGIAGAGKSVILKLVLGLVKPVSGNIYVLGHEVSSMREEDLFDLRQKIGMVFQESALFDSLTVRENVAFRLIEEGELLPDEIETRVREALRFVELEHTLDMFPAELSGGMRRRVAIARAIVAQPEILLYDSPTGGLDPVTSTNIMELILKQRDVYRTSALLVTHRLQDAFVMATHRFDLQANRMIQLEPGAQADVHTTFLLLRDGKVIFDGTAPALVASTDPYIKSYIS